MSSISVSSITLLFGRVLPFLLFFSATVLAQDTYKCGITGVVLDSETNKPLTGVSLVIDKLKKSTTTDNEGGFHFHDVISGTFTIDVSHVAYNKNNLEIEVNPESKKYFVIYLVPKTIEISTVVVTDQHTHSVYEEQSEIKSTLKGRELEKEMSLTLANTLKNETGMAVRSMGPAPARPVMRGLGGDRVMISEDNSKTTDLSSTSPDHAVTVEPFSVEKIEVFRGPKVLTQTSTTIGGIVNVVRHDIPVRKQTGISGYAGMFGETVNSGRLAAIGAEIPVYGINLKGEYLRKYSGDMDTPVGLLRNSYSNNKSGSAGASYVWNKGYAGVSFREYILGYGIPGGFVGAHPNGVDINLKRRQFDFKGRNYLTSSGINYLDYSFSRVYYTHEELEKNQSIGAQFRIINYLGNINFNHGAVFGVDKGITGISGELRDFEIGGRVYTPPTKSLNLAAYLFEQFVSGNFSLEFSSRFNFGSITPDYDDPESAIGYIRKRNFSTISASLSAIYKASKTLSVGANISRSTRIPMIEELFSGGPHLAAYSYEVGNPELKAETGYGTEIFLYHNPGNIKYNVSFFANILDNYIIPRNTGELNYQLFLPVYAYSGINAGFYGAEYQISWKIISSLEITNSGSFTYGEFRETGSPLPQIPPFKGRIEIAYYYAGISLFLNADYTSSQKRVDEFEEPTAGYFVPNLSLQYSITGENMVHNFSVNLDNIFDKEYRNHLSRVKSIMPESGRNIRLTYKLYFNF